MMSMRQCYKMQVLNILTGVHQKYGKGPTNVNVILANEHLLWPENQWLQETGMDTQTSLGIMAPLATAFCS